MLTFLHQYPSLWPAAFLLLFIPLLWAVPRSRRISAFVERNEPRLLGLWSLAGLGVFLFCGLACLFCPAFFELFESCGVSVAHSVFHGGTAYPGISSQERYCLPYGPVFFLVLGASEWLLGPGTFPSKLPCCLAAIAGIGLFWRILLLRGLLSAVALALTALSATTILAFRLPVFWTKSDPLIFLLVIVGIRAAYLGGRAGPVLLGACAGLAVGLKITAAIYFVPLTVIAACSGWRRREFLLCGAVLVATVLLPFVLMPVQFPWQPYLAFFRTVGREGLAIGPTLNYLRWVAMLSGLVFVGGRFFRHSTEPYPRRRRLAYFASLAFSLALVAVPACAVGAYAYHLMPFVPLAVLSFGNLFDAGQSPAFCPPVQPLWRAAAYAILAACLLVAFQTASQIVSILPEEKQVRACQGDLRQIIARFPGSAILMGSSKGDEAGLQLRFRHMLVSAGHPIGLDAAVVSDYQFGGVPDPDLPRLLAEICQRDPRPVLWLLPHGGVPFTSTNCYDGTLAIYPERFRTDFSERFTLRESTAFFDIYLPNRQP